MQEVNLYLLLKYYTKNWLIIFALTILGLSAGLIYNNLIQVPLYKSSATLLLIDPADRPATQDTTLINNYVELFKSRRVLEPVIKEQKLDISYESLVASIETKNDKDTEVIKVAISTKNAKTSQKLVSGAIVSFKEQVSILYGVDNVQIVDNASLSKAPYNIHTEIQLAIPTAAGFITSIIALFFVYDFNLTKKSAKKGAVQKALEEIVDNRAASKKTIPKKRRTLKSIKQNLNKKVTRLLSRFRRKSTTIPKATPKTISKRKKPVKKAKTKTATKK